MAPDITVIIATYNRAQELARTLGGMARTENGDFAVEFVVVDNGSTDQTKLVVGSFSDRLPIRYLFEPRSGKNCALNTALEKCKLGKIVVFTDDDVDVAPDWLVSIHSVCERWPNHKVFGGKINIIFPNVSIPRWANDPEIVDFAFCHHSYSNDECIYKDRIVPFGPNYWVRRQIFDSGRRFNEKVGPRPKNRIMGSETTFLFGLLRDGYQIVYSPTAVVGHRIQGDGLKLSMVCRRAYRQGRGEAYYIGMLEQSQQNQRFPNLKQKYLDSRIYRFLSNQFYALKVFKTCICSNREQRIRMVSKRIREFGYRREVARLLRR